MANLQTAQKVWNLIKEKNDPITKTRIKEDLVIPFKSVEESLVFLVDLGKIEIISNGITSLIRLKQNCEVTNK